MKDGMIKLIGKNKAGHCPHLCGSVRHGSIRTQKRFVTVVLMRERRNSARVFC